MAGKIESRELCLVFIITGLAFTTTKGEELPQELFIAGTGMCLILRTVTLM
jgi:hypothetical protein